MERLTDAQLADLADTAFQTINWAKREGMRKPQQVEQVVRAFEIALGYREAKIIYGAASKGTNLSALEMAQRVAKGEQL
ncbi:hypothetical protein [Mesorhizobium neociceri]|uniref:Uncharacterized protein n=1 Tax=Mesorhizobium neociceri TaxID=1307853 RepID=A0A838B6M1_9HYPH|nr:hypothetical protein [Mesorhizobium neociceri]MBA1141732.1 hypothetical protein [Mesorhizobium neociceri]